MRQVLFVLLILLLFVYVNCEIDLDTIISGNFNIDDHTRNAHCKDIDGTCQQWASNGDCYNTDFIRHFCPISCRNPKCTNHFPSFTKKSNHWRQITSTICHYPSIKNFKSNLYFHQINNISLNQCQNQCNNNGLCSHIIYIEKNILAQTPITDYTQLLLLLNPQTISKNTNDYDNDNTTINICIHIYIPLRFCHPICIDSDIINGYLINYKLDSNTQTKTAVLLNPFIFSTVYEYISLFSLYMNEKRLFSDDYWDIVNTFNLNNNIIPFEAHEYYYQQMDINNNGLPMLEAPKLSTYSGTNSVRLEFESRVNKPLEVTWVNTRNSQEIFQETLEANKWRITKARHSFNGHIFVIRDSETKQWLTSYKNNPSHTNVFITITPFGVCVRDEYQRDINIPKTAKIINIGDIVAQKLLKKAQQKRWGSDSNILQVWKLYETILWTANNKKIIGKVLNLMGQIFLFGSYSETFDFNIAWIYFKIASILDNGDSMYNMAFMIEKQLLATKLYNYLPKNLYRIAMLNYWCSAHANSQKAQLLLGFRYLNGIGMNKSCDHSVFFYEKLAKQVRNDARSLDKYVDVIDLSNPPLSAQDLNMNDHQIRYYKQYASMGRAWANNHLGQVYLFGLRGIQQNYELAAQHFEAAVNANDPIAANYLGRLYWNGLGRKRNLNKTIKLFTFAAERNVSQAQNNLAYMLWKGIGTERNMTESLKWFKRAVSLHFAQAMFYLGEIYKNGENGVDKNISQAVEYYILATKKRHYRSMYELGMFYKDGIGVDKDCEKAVALFKYVAEYHDVKFELENSRTSFENGHFSESFVIYSQKGEEGYINGQINAAYLANNGYHKYLYDIEENPFYDGYDYNDSVKMENTNWNKINDDNENGECKNNISVSNFIDLYNENDVFCARENSFENNNIFRQKYKHKVTVPENKELAFRYYSFAASQNHSRSLRILGDYYWYQWPPINLFSYLTSNISNNNSDIDEYDQRSVALSIAYLSTPQSIVKYSNFDKDNINNKNNNTIKVNYSEENSAAVQQIIENDYLLRHEVISCYLYELSSLQSSVDGQGIYDFAYCYEYGKGRKRNISKARGMYLTAMNKSTDAFIPVLITLLKMEIVNLYYLSTTNNLYAISLQLYDCELENIALVMLIVTLMIVLCIKSRRTANQQVIIDRDESVS